MTDKQTSDEDNICDRCGGTGNVVVEEYTMSTGPCPKCNPNTEDAPHPGDALCYEGYF
jgi:hypothetical protein